MKLATNAQLPKKSSAKVNDPDNPAWTEDMLGAPLLKRGENHQMMRLPPDDVHLRSVFAAQATLAARPIQGLNDPRWKAVSISLSVMYQASTCQRGCKGGPHVLEALVGRAYNLACSALGLLRLAMYDEALVLIRSIAEIHNLLLMFALESASITKWLKADKKTRMRDFSPVKVRIAIEKHGQVLILNEDWYSAMCEKYVHVQPGTRPNNHSEDKPGWVGGVVQTDGEAKVLGELFHVSFATAVGVCRWFAFDDLMEKLKEASENMATEGKSRR